MKKICYALNFILIYLCISCSMGSPKNEKQKTASDSPVWSEEAAKTYMIDYPELCMLEGDNCRWGYTYGLTGLAFLRLWKHTQDSTYLYYVKNYLDELIQENGQILTYDYESYNIDNILPARLLFTMYDVFKDDRYKIALKTFRLQLTDQPRTPSGGFWHKKKYPNQMWLDGIYMGSPFYVQYGLLNGEKECFDDVVRQIVMIEQKTRDPGSGLLYHAWDESKVQKWSDPETGCSPNFWGRAVGWYAMALVDVLDYIPEDHSGRDEIINVLKRLTRTITKYQDQETGLWYQVLDQADREGNYLEGSVSAMFSYALLKAARKGYINKSYYRAGLKAFNGITLHLTDTLEDDRMVISPVCAVAGLGGDPYRDGSFEYYVNERIRDNDPKAMGPFIMAALLVEEGTD